MTPELLDAAARLVTGLASRGQTLSTAESLTGGGLGASVTSVSGSSAVYPGGVVSYSTETKQKVLGVPAPLVGTHGVISGACAQAMAAGVRDLLGTDWALATTGVAGPEEAEGHPVGTVFLGLAYAGGVESRELAVTGTREEIREQTSLAALAWLLDYLGASEEQSHLG